MKYFVCLVDFYLEKLLLKIEHFLKKRKYTKTNNSFIKTANTKRINSIWIKYYKKFESNVKIYSIDRENDLIEMELIKKYRSPFFFHDAEKIKEQLIKMEMLGFVHKDFDFGNILIVNDRLVIVDPNCWIFHRSRLIEKMIEACDKKDIFMYKKYKKKFKAEIEND
jgi:hypothetical protein